MCLKSSAGKDSSHEFGCKGTTFFLYMQAREDFFVIFLCLLKKKYQKQYIYIVYILYKSMLL